jgi:SAM-dependent methyltransferase
MAGLTNLRAAIAQRQRRAGTTPPVESDTYSVHAAIDAEELLERYSVEELAVAAEAYFARVDDWRYHLSKPYAAVDEAPIRLAVFAAMLETLELLPGLTVLDFGAGSCWTSHAFAQLRCEVIACDVSPTALEMGRELFRRHPSIGDVPEPSFLVFDGRTLDLEDESIDRVACMDAFHHVPNRPDVLAELFRVLKPGGRAVFSEPGPCHSQIPQSQLEMRNFTSVERDIVMEVIESEARAVGFRDVQVAIYNPRPVFVDVADFQAALGAGAEQRALDTEVFLANHRLFVLHKPGVSVVDSRRRWSLCAGIHVELFDNRRVVARLENLGDAHWLPAGSIIGEVNLGVHLLDAEGALMDLDFQRAAISPDGGVAPGQVVDVTFDVRDLAPGSYRLEFDLVSERIAWFAENGNATVVLPIEISQAR